ncbi:MAG: ClbS/DfsB family four-helix bundle protein, partial [Coprobacillaceae bacterium]
MARPTTKIDLLKDCEANFNKLQDVINKLSPEKQEEEFPFEDRDHNIRDVLVHLYEWHQLLLTFINENL